MTAHLKAGPWVLDRRRERVEHPFGSIKQRMYQGEEACCDCPLRAR